jgi:hypothetical protein
LGWRGLSRQTVVCGPSHHGLAARDRATHLREQKSPAAVNPCPPPLFALMQLSNPPSGRRVTVCQRRDPSHHDWQSENKSCGLVRGAPSRQYLLSPGAVTGSSVSTS